MASKRLHFARRSVVTDRLCQWVTFNPALTAIALRYTRGSALWRLAPTAPKGVLTAEALSLTLAKNSMG
jgi:hypothetical protein